MKMHATIASTFVVGLILGACGTDQRGRDDPAPREVCEAFLAAARLYDARCRASLPPSRESEAPRLAYCEWAMCEGSTETMAALVDCTKQLATLACADSLGASFRY